MKDGSYRLQLSLSLSLLVESQGLHWCLILLSSLICPELFIVLLLPMTFYKNMLGPFPAAYSLPLSGQAAMLSSVPRVTCSSRNSCLDALDGIQVLVFPAKKAKRDVCVLAAFGKKKRIKERYG